MVLRLKWFITCKRVASKITFTSEEIDFTLKQKLKVRNWLTQIIKSYGFKLSALNFIFCNDDYLLKIKNPTLGGIFLCGGDVELPNVSSQLLLTIRSQV